MANMKLLLVLATVFLCCMTSLVRCEEAVELTDAVEKDEPVEQVADEEEMEEEVNDDDEDEQEEEEEEEADNEEEQEEQDPAVYRKAYKTYSYSVVSKPVITKKVYTTKVFKTTSKVSYSKKKIVKSTSCKSGGSAGYTRLGCFKDIPAKRAVAHLAGLKGDYTKRSDAINKCFRLAKAKGMAVFTVQNGGWCAASKSSTGYKKYGKSKLCKGGKGGPAANDAYRINGYTSLGCWKDSSKRAVPHLGGLSGSYKKRGDAVNKCFTLAKSKGMRTFAVQDGGWCAASKDCVGYRKYGASKACKGGKGGPWANNVYRIL